jgi:hypothetical protein
MLLVLGSFRGQLDSTEPDRRPVGGPMDRGVIYHISVIRDQYVSA